MTDEQRLVQFVLWRLRYCDLPADVQQAAARLARRRAYPRPVDNSYAEAAFRVTGFPADDDSPLIERRAHRAGPAVDEIIDGCRYVLVDNLGPSRP